LTQKFTSKFTTFFIGSSLKVSSLTLALILELKSRCDIGLVAAVTTNSELAHVKHLSAPVGNASEVPGPYRQQSKSGCNPN
jgi:hypothetical protein